MAHVRMTLEQAAEAHDVDRARIEATTEEDIRRYMIEDGEDPDAPIGTHKVVLPAAVVRKRTGLSQEAFAAAIGVPLATLRNWEQGRTLPDPARDRSWRSWPLIRKEPSWCWRPRLMKRAEPGQRGGPSSIRPPSLQSALLARGRSSGEPGPKVRS